MVKPLDPTNLQGPRHQAGSTALGGQASYTLFDATGHQTMAGDAKPWIDMLIEPVARTTGANAPTFSKWYDDALGTSRGVYLYTFDDALVAAEKEVFFSMQMPHGWDGSDGGRIRMHVHWVGDADHDNGAPYWVFEYAWKGIGEVYGNTSSTVTDGYNYTDTGTDANIVAHKHYVSKCSNTAFVNPTNTLSSILIGRLYRNSSSLLDTYDSHNCGLLYIDCHLQLSSLGSTDEYTK